MESVGEFSKSEFERLILEAKYNAETDWEEAFIRDLTKRYDKFGVETLLSEKESEILKRIAEGDEDL